MAPLNAALMIPAVQGRTAEHAAVAGDGQRAQAAAIQPQPQQRRLPLRVRPLHREPADQLPAPRLPPLRQAPGVHTTRSVMVCWAMCQLATCPP